MKDLIKKDWLNPLDVEMEYSISKSTLAKWRMINKNLPYSKVGKYIKYKRSDIEIFLNNNIVEVA
ncbi:hypothetical protein [Aliarcobacter butzleri]|uniref:Helix-turn-helix domain-containing protein n=1 Tax=Aliarcobacter butzleri L351 TaxID=1447259 RepID=A0A837J5P5_9BACT|nr:hypothetical protein [Aliarcobacter butzleri]KLE00919.1 hypothetical protein AF76_05710 [Aliarcobacter butzleri L351]KLE12827.1 hypothetical protein AF75_06715 [Aliarcobacter butzleri L350]